MPRITKVLNAIENQIRMRQREAAFDYTNVQLCFIVSHIAGVLMQEFLDKEKEDV